MKTLAFLVTLLLVSVDAHAALYKCIDANGQKRFSDKICAATGSQDASPARPKAPRPSSSTREADNKLTQPAAIPPTQNTATTTPAASAYACQGKRYCSQMTSCEEATYYLTHCPNVEIDGDKDGIPCEQQWCQ
jgi:hypothetical protein